MKAVVKTIYFSLVIFAVVVVVNFTNAIFFSSVSMLGDFDSVKRVGSISLYNPQWIYADYYETEYFPVTQIPLEYSNIHYCVSNKSDYTINEEEFEYYIRIVAENGSDNIPIEYNVHTFNTPTDIMDLKEGVGYGPFTMGVGSESSTCYSIKANWISTTAIASTQHLKVQVIREKKDNTLKVISEAPLNMAYTKDKVSPYIEYFDYISGEMLGNTTITTIPGATIDFTNQVMLSELGIIIPENYSFHDVRGAMTGWAEATTITIPTDTTSVYIAVYCLPVSDIPSEVTVYLNDNTLGDLTPTATIGVSSSGEIVLTQSILKAMHSAFNSKTSFSIYLKNQWGSLCSIATVDASNSFTLKYDDVFEAYGSNFSLSLGHSLYVKTW